MQAVHFDAPPSRMGDIVEVRIVAAHANSLGGRVGGEGRAAA